MIGYASSASPPVSRPATAKTTRISDRVDAEVAAEAAADAGDDAVGEWAAQLLVRRLRGEWGSVSCLHGPRWRTAATSVTARIRTLNPTRRSTTG